MQSLTGLSGLSGLVRSGIIPSDLPNLQCWLKADGILFQDSDGTTPVTANDHPVGYAFDHSGNGRHHVQSTASSRPLFKTNAQNGLPVIQFDGSNDLLASALDFSALTAAEAFLVTRKLTADSLNGALWNYGSATAQPWYPFAGEIFEQFGSTTRRNCGVPLSTPAVWNVYGVVSRSGLFTVRLNGAVQFMTATNTVGWASAANSRIGENRDSGSFYNGQIAELVIYGRELSAEERTAIQDYLKTKWATV